MGSKLKLLYVCFSLCEFGRRNFLSVGEKTETHEKRNFASSRKLHRRRNPKGEEHIFLKVTDGYEEEWMKIRIVNISSFSTKLGGVVVEREEETRILLSCNSIVMESASETQIFKSS